MLVRFSIPVPSYLQQKQYGEFKRENKVFEAPFRAVRSLIPSWTPGLIPRF